MAPHSLSITDEVSRQSDLRAPHLSQGSLMGMYFKQMRERDRETSEVSRLEKETTKKNVTCNLSWKQDEEMVPS